MSFFLLALVFVGVSAETNGGDSKWLRTARRLQEAQLAPAKVAVKSEEVALESASKSVIKADGTDTEADEQTKQERKAAKQARKAEKKIVKAEKREKKALKIESTQGPAEPNQPVVTVCKDFKKKSGMTYKQAKNSCSSNPNCMWRKKIRPAQPLHSKEPLRPTLRPLLTTTEIVLTKTLSPKPIPAGRRMQEEEEEEEDCECVDSGLSNYMMEIDCRPMSESDCLLFDGVCKWHHYLFDDESDCNYTPKCYEADYAPTLPVCKKPAPTNPGEGPEWDAINEQNCHAGYIARGEGWPRKMCDATIYTPDHDGVGNTKWWQWPNFLNPRNNELHVCEWRDQKEWGTSRCGVVNADQYQ